MNALGRVVLAMLLALVGVSAYARALAPAPKPPDAGFEQHLGAALPLGLAFVDSGGAAVHLRDYFGERPVLLVLGYYRCPQLCGLLMHGLLEALHESGLPARNYRIVRISIDPEDTPTSAAARRLVDLRYAASLTNHRSSVAPPTLDLLTGTPGAIERLTNQVGFRFQATAEDLAAAADEGRSPARFAHAAGVIVASPEGHVSRYLMGVRFEPRELRLALVDAAAGRIGDWTDRIALLCAHVDPRLGRYSGLLLDALRVFGVLLALSLGITVWRLQRRAARRVAS